MKKQHIALLVIRELRSSSRNTQASETTSNNTYQQTTRKNIFSAFFDTNIQRIHRVFFLLTNSNKNPTKNSQIQTFPAK